MTSAFFLVGPTAVGKTAVAQQIAEGGAFDILSADSMLVYRGMDIGTAKPTAAERGRVRYWGLDVVSPADTFSAGEFRRLAEEAAETCEREGRGLIVAGGTGLYVKAISEGLDELPPGDPAVRAAAERILAEGGIEALREAVRAAAPLRFAALRDTSNPRRLTRALELAGFQPPPGRRERKTTASFAGLRMDGQPLAERIRRRVEGMFSGGLLDEAEALRTSCAALSRTAMHAIGYEEAFAVLDGRCGLSEAVEKTMVRTRQLARRQMTWFRHQAAVDWIYVEPGMTTSQTADAVRRVWEKHGPTPLER